MLVVLFPSNQGRKLVKRQDKSLKQTLKDELVHRAYRILFLAYFGTLQVQIFHLKELS